LIGFGSVYESPARYEEGGTSSKNPSGREKRDILSYAPKREVKTKNPTPGALKGEEGSLCSGKK